MTNYDDGQCMNIVVHKYFKSAVNVTMWAQSRKTHFLSTLQLNIEVDRGLNFPFELF